MKLKNKNKVTINYCFRKIKLIKKQENTVSKKKENTKIKIEVKELTLS